MFVRRTLLPGRGVQNFSKGGGGGSLKGAKIDENSKSFFEILNKMYQKRGRGQRTDAPPPICTPMTPRQSAKHHSNQQSIAGTNGSCPGTLTSPRGNIGQADERKRGEKMFSKLFFLFCWNGGGVVG